MADRASPLLRATSLDGPGSLAQLDQATRLLAEARSLADIRGVRDLAEAARAYAAAARLGTQAVQHATVIKLEAERKAGQWLRATPKQRPGEYRRAEASTVSPRLADLGVTRQQARDWQTLARVDEAQWPELVTSAQRQGALSTNGIVQAIRSSESRARRGERANGHSRPEPVAFGQVIQAATAINLPLPSGSVDLQVTSCPYGLDVAYSDSPDDPDVWPQFMRAWLVEAYRIAAAGGRLALNVPLDTTLGGYRPTFPQAVAAAELAGWSYRFAIVWAKGNVSKSVARGSLDSPGAIHVMAPVEMIGVFHRGEWRRAEPSSPDLGHDEWLEWTSGVWQFGPEKTPWEDHPAPFPLELPRRLIKLLSFPGDLVVDQFCGSGTTILAALELGRRARGYDISPTYVASARRRLEAAGVWRADENGG